MEMSHARAHTQTHTHNSAFEQPSFLIALQTNESDSSTESQGLSTQVSITEGSAWTGREEYSTTCLRRPK